MTRSTKRCQTCGKTLRKTYRKGRVVYGHETYEDAKWCLEEKARRQAP